VLLAQSASLGLRGLSGKSFIFRKFVTRVKRGRQRSFRCILGFQIIGSTPHALTRRAE